MLTPKQNNSIRIFFQNVNSIDTDREGGDFSTICKDVILTGTDVLMLAEPNLCHLHNKVRNNLHQAASKELSHPLILLSSSKLKYRSHKKPGGTLTLTHGNTRSRVYQSGTDNYGRWSWLTLKGKNQSVTIITVYQVGDNQDYLTNAKKGCKTFRLQLYVMGLKDQRQGTPKELLLQDLTSFVEQKQELGHQIIICGDFNEVFHSKSNSIELASTLGLVDILHEHIGHQNFSTHQRNLSNQRIDYSLVSPAISESLQRAGYLPFGMHYKGDHRGFFMDFNTNTLLGSEIHDIAHPSSRRLNSKNKQNRARYVKAKFEELQFHKFFTRISELNTTETHQPVILEQLDRDWTRASIYAENQCKSYYEAPYIQEIANLRTEKTILCHIISQYMNKMDMQLPICTKMTSIPFILPKTTTECKQRISEINKEIRLKIQTAHQLRQTELKDKLEERKAKGDAVGSRVLKQIMLAEETKEVNRKLRAMKDNYDSQLNYIQVPTDEFAEPKDCSNWTTINSPEEIEKFLLQRNRKHFAQAAGTFPTIPPFSEDVDWAASTPESDLILNGEYDDS